MNENTTAFNEAIDCEHPDQFIDFSKVKLSNGQLPVPAGLQVSAASAQSLNPNYSSKSEANWMNVRWAVGCSSGNPDLLIPNFGEW